MNLQVKSVQDTFAIRGTVSALHANNRNWIGPVRVEVEKFTVRHRVPETRHEIFAMFVMVLFEV